MIWLEVVAWVVASVVSIPLLVIAVECLAALLPRRTEPVTDSHVRPGCVVLIPAHDEGANLIPTLQSAGQQLREGDRILVVADNCTDGTADIARSRGVEVVERRDPDRRGKGYALAFGRDALRSDPPDVVVVLDADCLLGPGALTRLTLAAYDHPAQAAYRMAAPPQSGPNRHVAAFAFLVKNFVRPLGLKRLGMPCLLTGTGMGFPWSVFRDAPLAHGHIVEDMGLAVDLIRAGHPPQFVPDAEVRGEFPSDDTAAGTQRRRWEHGHLSIIRTEVPRLLVTALFRFRPVLLAAALDLAVPPLSALAMLAAAAFAGLIGWGVACGSWGPAVLLSVNCGLAVAGLGSAWWRFGRTILPARMLLRVPGYAVRKIGLYAGFVTGPQRHWVRTQRSAPPPPMDSG